MLFSPDSQTGSPGLTAVFLNGRRPALCGRGFRRCGIARLRLGGICRLGDLEAAVSGLSPAWRAPLQDRWWPTASSVTFRTMEFDRITIIPGVTGGRPCIRGMRVSVSMIGGEIGAGRSVDEVLTGFPYLEREDVQALRYAAWRVNTISH